MVYDTQVLYIWMKTMVYDTKVLYIWMKNKDPSQCIKFVKQNKFLKCVPSNSSEPHDDLENLYFQNKAMFHPVPRNSPVDFQSCSLRLPFEFFRGHHCKYATELCYLFSPVDVSCRPAVSTHVE